MQQRNRVRLVMRIAPVLLRFMQAARRRVLPFKATTLEHSLSRAG